MCDHSFKVVSNLLRTLLNFSNHHEEESVNKKGGMKDVLIFRYVMGSLPYLFSILENKILVLVWIGDLVCEDLYFVGAPAIEYAVDVLCF